MKLEKTFLKVIGQYSFRPNLVSFSRIADFASEFESDFEEWRAPKSSEITLYSPEKKTLLTLAYDNITYSCEETDQNDHDIETGVGLIKKAYAHYLEEFKISEVKRMGFRVTTVFQTEYNFKELSDLMYKKFFSEETLSFMCLEAEDLAFVLDGKRNGFFNKVRLGPLRLEEAKNKIQNSFEFDTKIFGDGSLFMDIDVYLEKDSIKMSESIEVVDRLKKEYDNLSNGFLSILGN